MAEVKRMEEVSVPMTVRKWIARTGDDTQLYLTYDPTSHRGISVSLEDREAVRAEQDRQHVEALELQVTRLQESVRETEFRYKPRVKQVFVQEYRQQLRLDIEQRGSSFWCSAPGIDSFVGVGGTQEEAILAFKKLLKPMLRWYADHEEHLTYPERETMDLLFQLLGDEALSEQQ